MSGHPDQWWGGKTYAQHGEDLMIQNLFWLLKVDKPSYLDIGAHHPWNISNTALLYKQGSRGVNVEANPELMQEFRIHRPEDLNLCVGIGPQCGMLPFYMIDGRSGRNTFVKAEAERFVRENPKFQISEIRQIPMITLNELVDEHCPGGFPDLLSLDVEGLDIEILRSTKFDTGPKIICVEIGTSPDFYNQGDLLRTMMWEKGYYCVCRMGWNLLFVRKEYEEVIR